VPVALLKEDAEGDELIEGNVIQSQSEACPEDEIEIEPPLKQPAGLGVERLFEPQDRAVCTPG
jgi:hypothetical protein